jgi:hypothetical protein
MQDLSQLRDIKLPAEISLWPLAYGWWFVLIISILLIASGVYAYNRQRKKNKVKRQATKELAIQFERYQQHRDKLLFLQQCNEVLKRFCLHKHPEAVSLSGSSWSQYLNQHSPTNTFNKEQLIALSQGLYQAQYSYDTEAFYKACQLWLKNNNEITS